MVTTVCAHCGSRLRPEDAWCSLCLAPRPGTPGVPGTPGTMSPSATRSPAPTTPPSPHPTPAASPPAARPAPAAPASSPPSTPAARPAPATLAVPSARPAPAAPTTSPAGSPPAGRAQFDSEFDREAGGEAAFELPGDWEDGVVVTGARQTLERRAQAAASADRLIAELAAQETASRRRAGLGRLPLEVAARTGLEPAHATLLVGAAGGAALLLVLMVALTVLGLLL